MASQPDSILVNLWTFQSPAATELIQSSTRYHASWEFATSWEPAYRWMGNELKRLKGWDTQYPPVWTWYKCNHQRRAPGKGVARALLSELQIEQGVYLIKLDVPKEWMLLSSYRIWNEALDHCIDHGSIPENPFRKMFSPEEIAKDDDTQTCLPFIEREWIKRVEKIF